MASRTRTPKTCRKLEMSACSLKMEDIFKGTEIRVSQVTSAIKVRRLNLDHLVGRNPKPRRFRTMNDVRKLEQVELNRTGIRPEDSLFQLFLDCEVLALVLFYTVSLDIFFPRK